MGISHINGEVDVIVGKLSHHYFGWVEDAQGFVFISGFVVGLVYGGVYLKRSAADMQRAVYRRMLTIYSQQVGLILIFLVATALFFVFGTVPDVLRPYATEPVAFTLSSLALVAASMHMGILPMYIWFMLITPFILRFIHRGWTAPLIMLCITAWMVGQTGLLDVFTLWIENLISGLGYQIRLGIFFNVFGWQVLFFVGLFLGFRLAEGRLDLEFIKQRQYLIAFLFGLLAFIGYGMLDRLVFDFWISREFSANFLSHTSRQDFSILYVITFFLDLFLVTWLLVAGPGCGKKWITALAGLIQWIFTRRALVFLGQHSLHVFSFHILLVYVINILLDGRAVSELEGTLILVTGALSLFFPAWAHSRMQIASKKRRLSKYQDSLG